MSQAYNRNSNSFNVSRSHNITTFNYNIHHDESAILEWLSPLEPWVRHRDIAAQRVGNIGAWLLETREFKGWYDGNRENKTCCPSLFCDGSLGVGKSYIT